MKETFEKHEKGYQTPHWYRGIEYRKGRSIQRVEKPTNIHRARTLGYKAKQGYILVRVRTRRGGAHKKRAGMGRRPKRMGLRRITPGTNRQVIAEQRAQRKYPNLEVLNSYPCYKDGIFSWYEVILVDPSHPVIKNDPKINWICEKQHKKRALRGLTSANKKSRGLSI